LPEGMPVTGVILVDQIRVLDRPTRGFRAVGRVPEAVMEEVRAKLAALLGINRAL
jgi:mRNA interferase MazF